MSSDWVGKRGLAGNCDGYGSSANFAGLSGLALDYVYGFTFVADSANHVIKKISSNGKSYYMEVCC